MNEKDYIVETLDPKDFDEWVQHCAEVFDFDYATDYFRGILCQIRTGITARYL